MFVKTDEECLDEAAEIVPRVLLHHLDNETTVAHLHRALVHLREACLAEDGQQARSVDEATAAERSFHGLMVKLEAAALKNEQMPLPRSST